VLVQDGFVSNKNKTRELRVSQFFSNPTASEITGLAFSTGL
jgi:secreted PhoX family phosphatase